MKNKTGLPKGQRLSCSAAFRRVLQMGHGKFQLRKIIAMMIFKTNTDYTISRPLKEYLHMVLLCLCLAYFFGFTQSLAGEFTTLDMSKVKVGGEVGRHINQTIYNNLLAIDVERDFLSQFRRVLAQRPARPRGCRRDVCYCL